MIPDPKDRPYVPGTKPDAKPDGKTSFYKGCAITSSVLLVIAVGIIIALLNFFISILNAMCGGKGGHFGP